MPVTRHPLHRSGREALPHPAPTLGMTASCMRPPGGGPTTGWPYMRQRLGHARPALRPVRVTCRMFPLVTALPSTRSAAHRGALFAGFFGVESEEVGQCGPPSVRSIKRLVQFSRKPLSSAAPLWNHRWTRPGMRCVRRTRPNSAISRLVGYLRHSVLRHRLARLAYRRRTIHPSSR